VNENGSLKLLVNGEEITLLTEDLLIDIAQTEGYVSENDNDITVVLDTNLTPELIEEGFVRELISKIQTMRKEADFQVTDKIIVYADKNRKILEILTNNKEDIKGEVLAFDIITGELKGYSKEWNINGETVMIGVAKG